MRLVLVLSLFLVAAGVVVHFDREYRVSVLKRVGDDVSSIIGKHRESLRLESLRRRWDQQTIRVISPDKREILKSCNHPAIVQFSKTVEQFCSDPVAVVPTGRYVPVRNPCNMLGLESELYPGKRRLSRLLIASGALLFLYCLVLVCYSCLRVIWRKRHELCGVCGYSNRGIQSAVCPECGTTWDVGLLGLRPFRVLKYFFVYLLVVPVMCYGAHAYCYSKKVQASIEHHEANLKSSADYYISMMIDSAFEDEYFIESSQSKTIFLDVLSTHAGNLDYVRLTNYCIENQFDGVEASLYKAFHQKNKRSRYNMYFATPDSSYRSDQQAAIIALFGYCNTPDSLGYLIDILDSSEGDEYRLGILVSLIHLDLCKMEDVVREKLGSMHDAGKRQDVEFLLERCSDPEYQYKQRPSLDDAWEDKMDRIE